MIPFFTISEKNLYHIHNLIHYCCSSSCVHK